MSVAPANIAASPAPASQTGVVDLTVFGNGAKETSKTDETDSTTNADFMTAVFRPSSAGSPMVVTKKGDPKKGPWPSNAWLPGSQSLLPASSNNYFTLATFTPNSVGKLARKKEQFCALYAVMLDDVGTKTPKDRLTLPPSWMIETSSGNYQAGYILSEPLTDSDAANNLVTRIIDAGLCDPGANGPATRLARLPVGVNGKRSPQFQCRLDTFEPDRRYSVQELVDGLGLKEAVAGRTAKPRNTTPQHDEPLDGDPVHFAGPGQNTVLAALHARSIYKDSLGAGKHDITCPWMAAHTDAVDHGSAYFEPSEDFPIGGFNCLHGHCDDRGITDLLKFLDIEPVAARMKPSIRVTPGEIHRIADAAEREIANSGEFYQRAGLICAVSTEPSTLETRVQTISQPALLRALAAVAIWERFDARRKAWIRIDPPSNIVAVVHDASSYRHLPVLKDLARQPYLRPDGTLVIKPGYDPHTKTFGVFDPSQFGVPEEPTRGSAEAALKTLDDLLDEFRFAQETDRTAALAAILTATIRASLSHAPMFHVRAHEPGSGKSYLCELVTAFATPQRGTPTTFPKDDEECRKLLLAELLRAPAVVEFDNLTGDLVAHKSLCTVLTSENYAGRILGVSKTANVGTRTLLLSSGNNVGPVADMTRRCIVINLDPGCEVPASRSFTRPDLVREVLHERGRFVSAALTIVRAWIVAARPRAKTPPLAGFSEWADLCQQPLLWLGRPSVTDSAFVSMAADPDREVLGCVLLAWKAVFGPDPARVRNAVQETENGKHSELREALLEVAGERGEINRRKLGWWLRKNAGRIVGGTRFARCNVNAPSEVWKVEKVAEVSSVLSVSGAPTAESVTTSGNDNNNEF